MSFTPEQLAIYALLFIAGLFIGLALHPGGKKWKAKLRQEEAAHARTQQAADQRVKAAEQRQRELETELARRPVTVDPALARPEQKPVFISPHETLPEGQRPTYLSDREAAPTIAPHASPAPVTPDRTAQDAARPAFPNDRT